MPSYGQTNILFLGCGLTVDFSSSGKPNKVDFLGMNVDNSSAIAGQWIDPVGCWAGAAGGHCPFSPQVQEIKKVYVHVYSRAEADVLGLKAVL